MAPPRWIVAISVLLAGVHCVIAAGPRARVQIQREYGRLPLRFERNQGQVDSRVKFYARGSGYTLFLTRSGAALVLRSQKSSRQLSVFSRQLPGPTNSGLRMSDSSFAARRLSLLTDIVRMTLEGANPNAKIMGLDELPGKSNYLIGNDPVKWRRDVPNYVRVKYQGVYPGVDLVYYGDHGQLEYDFVIQPGADPKAIRLAIAASYSRRGGEHSSPLQIAANGDLVIGTAAGEVRFRKPVVYQTVAPVYDRRECCAGGLQPTMTRLIEPRYSAGGGQPPIGNRKFLDGRFVLLADNLIGFEVSNYDHSKSVVIDPVLSYSTYLGGSDLDYATGIALDSSGNTYVAGYTASLDFPVAGGVESQNHSGSCSTALSPSPCFDAFITKLNATGTALAYSTYLGGTADDRSTGIAVDASGNAYITGYTDSSDFPTANAYETSPQGGSCPDTAPYPCYDAFVAKLAPTGASLVYSTLLGGSLDDYGMAIASDGSGNAYIAGITESTDFHATPGAFQPVYNGGPYDGFVAKFGPTGGAPIYATYLGGSNEDHANAIAVDSTGSAYVAGQTDSSNFPTVNAFQAAYAGGPCGCFDAFVAKLDPTGAKLLYATYLGGTGGDYANAIALDASDKAFIAGWTTSPGFPVTTGAYQTKYGGSYDAFVAKLSSSGNALIYSTYLGGIDPDDASGIALDASGDAYVTGWAYGAGFPSVNALESGNRGYYDAFVAELNPSASSLIYSTELGGSGDDFGTGIAVDLNGNADIAGATFSVDFPVTPGAVQPVYGGGGYDAFIAQINPGTSPSVATAPGAVTFPAQEVNTSSVPAQVLLMNAGTAALNLTAVSVSGDFVVTASCPSSLPPAGTCPLNVTFTPTAPGGRTGQLSFTDNAAGSPQSLALSGEGSSGAAFALSAAGDPASVIRGADSATFNVSASSPDGFVGPIALACSGAAPANCAFTPASITPGASSTLTVSGLAALAANTFHFTVTGTSGSQSSTLPLEILIADFSLTGQPASTTLAAGQTANFALALTSINGFSQGVSLTCSGAPAGSQCSVSPDSIAPTAAGATATLTVTTTTRSQCVPWKRRTNDPRRLPIELMGCAVVMFAMLEIATQRRRRRFGSGKTCLAVRLLALGSLAAALAACGAGGSSGMMQRSGTPPGTYTLTVNATTPRLTHTINLTLVVQ